MLDEGRFETTATLSTTSTYLATAIYNLCLQFEWDQFVFLYNQLGDNGKCNSMQADFLVSWFACEFNIVKENDKNRVL